MLFSKQTNLRNSTGKNKVEIIVKNNIYPFIRRRVNLQRNTLETTNGAASAFPNRLDGFTDFGRTHEIVNTFGRIPYVRTISIKRASSPTSATVIALNVRLKINCYGLFSVRGT